MPEHPASSPATASPDVLDRVRTLVRERGTDPLADPRAVRAAILDVLDEVSTPETERELAEVEAWAREIHDLVAGYGPLQRLFDDPDVEELWWNEPGRVFCARHGRTELTTVVLTEVQVHDLVERMLRTSGRRVDVSQPFVDALLPDGSRLHVVIPDVTRRHWAVNMRRHVLPASRLRGPRRDRHAHHRRRALPHRSGRRRSQHRGRRWHAGRQDDAAQLPAQRRTRARARGHVRRRCSRCGVDRPDWVAMQTRQVGLEGTGEITLRRLVVEALRMRPDRLVVGEVRQAEALDLLVALNSGMPGMTSVHANSARDAVTKLCVLPMLAGENVTAAYIVPTVASSVDLVVHAATRPDGRRRVREIVALSGRVEDGVVETSDIFVTRGGELVRAAGFPPHAERFEAHGIDIARCWRVRDGCGRRTAARARPAADRAVALVGRAAHRSPHRTARSAAPPARRCGSGRRRRPRVLALTCAGAGSRRRRADAVVVAAAATVAHRVRRARRHGSRWWRSAVARRSARSRWSGCWPDAVDDLASAVRAGMSLPDGVARARRARARRCCGRRSRGSPPTTA